MPSLIVMKGIRRIAEMTWVGALAIKDVRTVGFVSSLCVGKRKGVELHMRETFLDIPTTQTCSYSVYLLVAAEHKSCII